MPDIKFTKFLLFTNCLVPLALLGWDAYHHRLGANPIEFATRSTGVLTLVFLFLTLAVTPLRKLTRANWLVKLRKMLGLYAFFYGALHLLTYVWFDKFFSVSEIVKDTWQRRFILVGMASFLLMAPLAATSTNAAVKRLGGKRWARLHKLVYLTAVGGVVHYWMIVKAITSTQIAFAAVLAALLGARLVFRLTRPQAKAQRTQPRPAA
ncbi:MAG TPA: protein-methionine-sulfoxide reductase heme-binding subunit MsrQ [Pyrinomonadaceae bacterium]|jgi:sulfoxide reductase heme-binding subunit YedZ|nr:protein-methionine-sulfoxide reductase heme-binding subunit MsrQ [Pyrinomonadaceae bacterium]